ncbi:MAG: hypothetical protein QOF58_7941 [Pseudonocardiales bacterium]|nr:hypothetical protein [Pseudonocardiales bacterium]
MPRSTGGAAFRRGIQGLYARAGAPPPPRGSHHRRGRQRDQGRHAARTDPTRFVRPAAHSRETGRRTAVRPNAQRLRPNGPGPSRTGHGQTRAGRDGSADGHHERDGPARPVVPGLHLDPLLRAARRGAAAAQRRRAGGGAAVVGGDRRPAGAGPGARGAVRVLRRHALARPRRHRAPQARQRTRVRRGVGEGPAGRAGGDRPRAAPRPRLGHADRADDGQPDADVPGLRGRRVRTQADPPHRRVEHGPRPGDERCGVVRGGAVPHRGRHRDPQAARNSVDDGHLRGDAAGLTGGGAGARGVRVRRRRLPVGARPQPGVPASGGTRIQKRIPSSPRSRWDGWAGRSASPGRDGPRRARRRGWPR